MTEVTQGGRNRSFSYDSVNRLRWASSPETGPSVDEGDAADGNGSYLYAYDLAGNLTSRTDPKSIVTSWITQYKDAQRSIDAYGKENVDNGVTVRIGNVEGESAHVDTNIGTTAPTTDNPLGQKITVTANENLALSGNVKGAVIHAAF